MRITGIAAFAVAASLCFSVHAVGKGSALADPGAMAGRHFHPMGNHPPNTRCRYSRKRNKLLPPSDTRDFDEQKKGFIAEGEAGNVVWDKERCRFILEGEYLKSIHPSLLRQSTLNMNYGLC